MKNHENSLPLFELRSIQTELPRIKITSSDIAANFIRRFYGDDINIFESSFILLLNNQLLTIGYAKISQGGITGTIIDPRIVAHYAVKSLSTSVIIAHNHPSGANYPSEADKTLTAKIKQGLELLDITLADHIILTAENFYSFRQEHML